MKILSNDGIATKVFSPIRVQLTLIGSPDNLFVFEGQNLVGTYDLVSLKPFDNKTYDLNFTISNTDTQTLEFVASSFESDSNTVF